LVKEKFTASKKEGKKSPPKKIDLEINDFEIKRSQKYFVK